ncbi:MAG: cytochrome c family protein [Candidatus Electrothrix communis]|nr:MAG: cytochrome c family protein [Candidatus Electrothrix communis]
MKRKYIGLAMGLAAGLALAATSGFAQDAKKPELLSFKPSNLQWEKTKADFTAPSISTCAGCHPKQYEEWQGSMHAMAFQDPVYLGELNLAIKAVGKEISKQCEGCHTPAAFVKGETAELDFKNLSPLAKAGVSCDVCHSIKKFTHWETPPMSRKTVLMSFLRAVRMPMDRSR